jgi:hypothetical protein
VIIAKDAEVTLEETLDSLVDFKEVILYLNNSSDNTKKIAHNFSNVNIIDGEFIGFGSTKNQAAHYSSNDWIFSLDSDEVLDAELLKELVSLELDNEKKIFELKRDNYFLNKKIKYSGWGKDYLNRIYNKNFHAFNDNMVHEFIELKDDSKVVRLKSSFKHNAVTNINQFLQKIIKYSDLAAKDKKTCSFFVVLVKAKFAFVKTYIFQFGFLDGWRGVVIALSNFNGKFFRYTKRYINCKEK